MLRNKHTLAAAAILLGLCLGANLRAQDCGLLTNVSFGSGAAGWSLSPNANVVGDRVLLDTTGARVYQRVGPLLPGETYALTFERVNPYVTLGAIVDFYDAAGAKVGTQDKGFWRIGAPIASRFEFEVPAGVVAGRVTFQAWGQTAGAGTMSVRAPCLELVTTQRLRDFITTSAQGQRTDVDVRSRSALTGGTSWKVPAAGAAASAEFFVYVRGDLEALREAPTVTQGGATLPTTYRRVTEPAPDGLAVYTSTVALGAGDVVLTAGGLPAGAVAAGLVAYGAAAGANGPALDQGGVVYGAYAPPGSGWTERIRVPLAPSFEARDVEVVVPLGLLAGDGTRLTLEAGGPGHATVYSTSAWYAADVGPDGRGDLRLQVANVPSGQSYLDLRIHSPAGAGQRVFVQGAITATNRTTAAVSVTSTGLCGGSLGREMFPEGDFGTVEKLGGTVGTNFPGITWGPPPSGIVAPGYSYIADAAVGDGGFGIVTSTEGIYQESGGFGRDSWIVSGDRGDEPDGYAMLVNADFEPGIFFYKQIDDLCEGTDYVFSVAILNVDNPIMRPNNPNDPGPPFSEVRILPDIDFVLAPVGSSVQDLESLPAAHSTGPIMNDSLWHNEGFTFTMPPGVSGLVLAIRNNAPGGGGNDILLDDISFRACGPTTIIANTGDTWCAGNARLAVDEAASGSYVSPAYRWEHSRDYGVTWQTVPGGNASTLAPTGYVAGDRYRLRVAGSSAIIDEPNCYVFSNELIVTNGDCPEVCGNGLDDDLDGLTDCDDPDCASYGTCDCSVAEGKVRVEYYLNKYGNYERDLRYAATYPDAPDLRLAFATPNLPDQFADHYGARVSGLLRAPATGDYRFNVTGDNEHVLYLSTDASPANLARVAGAEQWSREGDHDKYPGQTSAPIALERDRLYYFEAIVKEGVGGDNLEVYWRPPGVPSWAILPSSALVFPIDGCPTEVCGNGIDDDGDGVVDCPTASGRVFEDINYGGGAGRAYAEADASARASGWAAGAVGAGGARVDFFTQAGNYVTTATADAAGRYAVELPAGDYEARLDVASVRSNRASNGTGEVAVPVQTYRRTPAGNHLRGAVGRAAVTRVSTTATAGASGLDFGVSFSVVTTTADAGAGSLRQWIVNANELANDKLDLEDAPAGRPAFAKTPGDDVSVFELPGAGVRTIAVATTLPTVTDARTVLTGYSLAGTQVGSCASRRLLIELANAGGPNDGIRIGADGAGVSGFSITGFVRGVEALATGLRDYHIWGNYIGLRPDGTTVGANASAGVYVANAGAGAVGTDGDGVDDASEGNLVSGNGEGIVVRLSAGLLIAGNCVGVDATGTQARGNTYNGIHLRDLTAGSVVGFDASRPALTPAAARNVIGGNGTDGVRLTNASRQRVAGNYVGTDHTGTRAIGNGGYGIQLVGAVTGNRIGTDADGARDAAERNVVSGNRSGFRMAGSTSGSGNVLAGNYFGVDATGNRALPNRVNALNFEGATTGTTVGTDGDGVRDGAERNVISGNGEDGIRIVCDGIRVSGNYIGVGADGTAALGNGKRGIFLDADPSDNCFGYCPGMSNGDPAAVGNVIANNAGVGLALSTAATSVRNRISRNRFYANGSLAIDLGYDLVTANDDGDGDAGANTLLNFPVVTYGRAAGGRLRVRGFAPAGSAVEVYVADAGVSPSPLPSGYTSSFGEGDRYVATVREGGPGDGQAGTGTYADDGTGATGLKTAARFDVEVAAPAWLSALGAGALLTATATDAQGNTSEFGPRVELRVAEICDNGIDDDGDGLVDCRDPDCPKGTPVLRVSQ